MIHILHHQHDTLVDVLTNKGEKKYWGDLHEIDIEGLNTHQFTTTATNPAGQYLEKRSRYLLPAEGETYFHEFIIMEAVTRHDEKNIYAKASYHDLNTQKIVTPRTYTNWTVEQFVAHALHNSEWQVGQVEYFGIRSTEIFEHLGAYDFLTTIRNLFNKEFEMRFRVETYGNKITGRYIDLVYSLGRNTKKEITYGKDLAGIEKRVFNERIVTQLIVLGPTREDGTRHQVTVNNEEAFQRWNRNGYHITAVYTPQVEDQNISVSDLTILGEQELNARIDSVVEYTVDAIAIEKLFPHEQVLLGDNIRVKDPEFVPPLYAEARVIRIVRSTVDETQKSYTIGEVIEYNTEDLFKTFQELQQNYGLRVVKNEIPPEGNAQIIWIDTSQTPNVPHTWDGLNWVRFAPIAAAEIGAETPQGAEDKAAVAAGAALDSATLIAQQEAAAAEQAAKQAAATDASQKATAAQQAAIDAAAIDASTKAGQALDSATTIAEERAATAQTNAQTYADQQDAVMADTLRGEFQTFAEGIESGTIVVQSPTEPTNPVTDDLWIDISVIPHVWRRWNGTTWVNATTTSLSELGGVLSQNQLAVDTITADHIAPGAVLAEAIGKAQIVADKLAAGAVGTTAIADNAVTNTKVANLDAAKITTGILNAARVQIGSTTTFAPNYDPTTKETPEGAQTKAETAAGAALDTATTIAQQEAAAAETNAINAAATDATNKVNAAVNPINERLVLWQYLDTTFIDGGSIYTNSITANQIAAGAITADELGANAVIAAKIAANAITAEKIATGAVTANAIAANSISSNMIATAGLDAGVIKFGTMSGDRIAANTIDANRLKAGTVIASDIIFTGQLSGANGTFSGTLDSADGAFSGNLNARTILLGPDSIYGAWELENTSTLSFKRARRVTDTPELVYEWVDPINITVGNGGMEFGPESGYSYFRFYGDTDIAGNFFTSGNIRLGTGNNPTSQLIFGNLAIRQEPNADDPTYTTTVHFEPVTLPDPNDTDPFYFNFRGDMQINNSKLIFYNGNLEFAGWKPSFLRIPLGTIEVGSTGAAMRIPHDGEPTRGIKERGFCGYGTSHGGKGTNVQVGGVGVNFRVKKSYVPSTITFTLSSSYGLNANAADINAEGFWLYTTVSVGGYTGHAYWRGYYEA